MHAFTLTMRSYAHVKDFSDNDFESIAQQYAVIFDDLLEKYGLDKHFTTQVYWHRGCFELCFQFLTADPAILQAVATYSSNIFNTTWEVIKVGGKIIYYAIPLIAAYPHARDNYPELISDFLGVEVEHKGKNIKPSELLECPGLPAKKAKMIEKKLGKALRELDKKNKSKNS